MDRADALLRLEGLLTSLDASTATVNTSMRLPAALRDAAAVAVEELGVSPSVTALVADGLRSVLEGVLALAALEAHCATHSAERPSLAELAELAVAAAELDGSPLARRADLLRDAAAELSERRPNPKPEDVVLWAEARNLPAA